MSRTKVRVSCCLNTIEAHAEVMARIPLFQKNNDVKIRTDLEFSTREDDQDLWSLEIEVTPVEDTLIFIEDLLKFTGPGASIVFSVQGSAQPFV